VSKKSTSIPTKKRTDSGSDAVQFLEKLVGKLTLAKVLRSTRECDELSQRDFADLLGISKHYLSDLEKGRRIASPSHAWAWAKKLGYHPRQWAELAIQDMLEKEGLKGIKVRLEVA
jgi:transcriptional regulator with XRE-family HTH domain